MIYQSSYIITIVIFILSIHLTKTVVNSLELTNNINGFPFLPTIDIIKPVSGLVVISSYIRRSNIHNHQPRLSRSTIDKRFIKVINRNLQHSFNNPAVFLRRLGNSDHQANLGTTRGQEKNDVTLTSQSSKHKTDGVSNMDMSFSTLFN